jgi:hydrogenase nickel incorporation protein HypB
MCRTCGCDALDHTTDHEHEHAHPHDHHHDEGRARVLRLEHDVLARNDRLAMDTRRWLVARGIAAVNVMASPGAGKTTVLERTIRELRGQRDVRVVEGDQATELDAARIRALGAPVVQINTGSGCHLDATMVARALETLSPPVDGLVLIENVGNLVCPALFDLGEALRVVIASVAEGDDKPIKYPHMFRAADAVLLNKMDLQPYVAFDVDRFRAHVQAVNPRCVILPVSATRDDGLAAWFGWLRAHAGTVGTSSR